MTAVVVLTCDGHRHGQPCRGAHTVPPGIASDAFEFVEYRRTAGWRHIDYLTGLLLCPSRGHDEEPPP